MWWGAHLTIRAFGTRDGYMGVVASAITPHPNFSMAKRVRTVDTQHVHVAPIHPGNASIPLHGHWWESLLHASAVRCLFPWQPRGGNSESRVCSPVPSMPPYMPAPTLRQCWGVLRSPSACVRGCTHMRETPPSRGTHARSFRMSVFGEGGASRGKHFPFPFPSHDPLKSYALEV